MKHKALSFIFALAVGVTMVYADNPSGTCGENLTWTISNDTLYITGSGYMSSYSNQGPWISYSPKYVVLSDGVQSIGRRAFAECRFMEKVIACNGITTIGNNAFLNCTSLTEFSIPDNVSNVGELTFKGCANLSSVTFGKNIVDFGKDVFLNCTRLQNIIWNVKRCNGVCNGWGTSTTTGYDYSTSQSYTYEYLSFDIFQSIRPFVTTIVIGDSVEQIPMYFCYRMTKLNQISIPENIIDIGRGAFEETGIYNNQDNWENDVLYIGDCLIKAKETLTGNYAIRGGTRIIADDAFYICPNLQAIIGGDDLKYIGSGAFESCTSLQSVTNIQKVTHIRSGAFGQCTGFDVFVLPDSLEYLGSGAFAHCSNLTSITIPNKTSYIGSSAFESCTNLSSITLSESLDSICKATFKECSSLLGITIPNNVQSLGEEAFYNCDTLKHINLGQNILNIGKDCFYSCNNLDSVILPSKTRIIGESAFAFCPMLRHFEFNNGLERIEQSAFYSCTALDSIRLPLALSNLQSSSFSKCSNLKYVVLPDSLSTIQPYTFSGDTSLTEITIGEKMLGFQPYSFKDCKNIQIWHWNAIEFESSNSFQDVKASHAHILTFGDKVKHIPSNLSLCTSAVTFVNIPASVESIGKYAFSSSLDSVKWNPINYPEKLTRSPFSSSIKYFKFGEGVERVPNYLCSSMSVDSLILPESVQHIGRMSFADCTNLRYIYLPDALQTIDTLAFKNCSRLNVVTIPDNVKTIASNTFLNCSDLALVVFGEGIETIENSAFYGCWNMRYVEFPENVQTIEPWAFSGCTNINRIILLPTTPPVCQNCALPTNVPTYIPCGTYNAYAQSDWANYQLQYSASSYSVSGNVLPDNSGSVKIENSGSACEAVRIEAIPYSGYYFVQWEDGETDNPRYVDVSQDTTFTAIFALQTFMITFVDDNDTIFTSQEYEYGDTPIPPTDPIKTGNEQYSYTFAGWSPQIVPVIANATYKATYNSIINKYTITFMNGDDVLSADLWDYGTTPRYTGATPTRPNDEEFTYTFKGWTPEIVAVTMDATYYAAYDASPIGEGIENINVNGSDIQKILRDGHIFILRGDKTYTLQGQRVR